MAKLHDTEERLRARLRELTAQCRQIREELARSTQQRLARNTFAEDRPASSPPPTPRRKKPSPPI